MFIKPTYEELEKRVAELVSAEIQWDTIQTALMEREVDLQAGEQKFRDVFDGINSGIAIYKAAAGGTDFILHDINRAGEIIEDVKKGAVIGKRLLDIFPAVLGCGFFEVLQRVWNTGVPEDVPVFQYEDGRISGWRKNFVFKLPSGEVVASYMGEIRVKEMEKVLQLRDKMAALGQIAAGIAHEIRNPLSGINIFLEGIGENFEDPQNAEDIRMLIHEARKASGKIEATIKRVLDFARPRQPHMIKQCINIPIRDAVQLAGTLFRRKGIAIETDLGDTLPALFMDSLLMEQVVLNLMNNAAEAMAKISAPKRIRIATRSDTENVFLSVSDSGTGVPEKLINKIFNPFFSTKADGSGIGLSFCQRVITAHNGTIRVFSSRWGGAEFRIKLPIDKRVLSR